MKKETRPTSFSQFRSQWNIDAYCTQGGIKTLERYVNLNLKAPNWGQLHEIWTKLTAFIANELLIGMTVLICKECLERTNSGLPSVRRKGRRALVEKYWDDYLPALETVLQEIRMMNPSKSNLSIQEHIQLISLLNTFVKSETEKFFRAMKAIEKGTSTNRTPPYSLDLRHVEEDPERALLLALFTLIKRTKHSIRATDKRIVGEFYCWWMIEKNEKNEDPLDVGETLKGRVKADLGRVRMIPIVDHNNGVLRMIVSLKAKDSVEFG